MAFNFVDWASLQKWTHAKTRAHSNPHWYLVRQKVRDNPGFDEAVRTIYREGEPRVWGGKLYRVLYKADGYHYWCMGWPVDETVILNRTKSDPEHDQTRDVHPDVEYRWMSNDGGDPRRWAK
jgi:hypothetical protein